MKTLFALTILLLLAQPVFAELTPTDIKTISDIIKKENALLETRLREYVDLKFEVLDTKFTTKLAELDTKFTTKFDGLSRQLTFVLILVTGLIALIVVAIGIPQIIIARKQKDQSALEAEIKILREKIELLEQTRLVKPH
jgi:hypothetical protein